MRTRVFPALVLLFSLAASSGAFAQTPAPAGDATSPPSCPVANTPAVVLTSPDPVRPPLAAQLGVSGTVSVAVTLDATGHAGTRQITQSPNPLLNAAALDVARNATFSAAIRDCTPIASRLVVPVVFARTVATGAAPAIGAFFIGTWYCTSERNAQSVVAFGRNAYGGSVMIGGFSSVSTLNTLGASVELYAEKAGVTTQVFMLGGVYANRLFVGTSHGWNGDRLVFAGDATVPPRIDPPAPANGAPMYERVTYIRSGTDRYTRTVETAASDAGPWSSYWNDSCARIVVPEKN